MDAMFFVDPDDRLDDFLVLLVGAVGKVEPEDMDPLFGQGQEDFIIWAGGAYGGNNLGILMWIGMHVYGSDIQKFQVRSYNLAFVRAT